MAGHEGNLVSSKLWIHTKKKKTGLLFEVFAAWIAAATLARYTNTSRIL